MKWPTNVNLEQEINNLACGDHWILLAVVQLVLRKADNEEISYWEMVSCILWPCSQRRSERGKGATGIATFVQLARAGTWWPRSFHKNRMGYLPWLISSHQSVFMNGCLIISHTCLPCLPSGRTLLFWRGLFVVERKVSWETWESSELRRWERFMSGVRW